MTPTVQALRKQLQQLKAQHDAGSITEVQFNSQRGALERKLLDALAAVPDPETKPRMGVQTWALVGGLIIAIAAVGYGVTGRPDAINTLPADMAMESAPHELGDEQMAELVERLAERMKSNPDDAEGWVMLGRSYAAMGKVDEATDALAQVVKLRPDDADALADYADALAVRNGRSLEGEPLQLIEKALQIDPKHLKSLALAGTAAFNRSDYAKAVGYWDRAAQAGPPDSPLVQMSAAGAAEARNRGQLPPAAPHAEPAAAAAQPVPAAAANPASAMAAQSPAAAEAGAAIGAGATVSGTVMITPELLGKVSPDDSVYIFARASEGSRMPLALLRKQVKDLPLDFTLDNSMAMSPSSTLSTATQVVVGARVARSGQPMPQPGDLEGLSQPVGVGGKGVKVLIAAELK